MVFIHDIAKMDKRLIMLYMCTYGRILKTLTFIPPVGLASVVEYQNRYNSMSWMENEVLIVNIELN